MSPSALPDGDPAPPDGRLPGTVVAGASARTLGFYLHVPFCRVRCGYCDFNTYTADELAGSASQASYAAAAHAEIALAAQVVADAGLPRRPVSTVFVGGGTPTLLPASLLVELLADIRERFGLADGPEITTEANPDSVSAQSLAQLAAGGFTRVSFGMQSSVPSVLAVLDRTHDPRRMPDVLAWARAAGLGTSLDLIYGTPGESLADWEDSLRTVIGLRPDHVSAYALTVEPGTRLHAQVRRGAVPDIDPDDQADKYEFADRLLSDAGYHWYEVSNFARTAADRARHNLAYWTGGDWWGIGPGAHSHVGGVRWWNVKHPRAYAQRLADGVSPAAARECPDAQARHVEDVMLAIRLADGFDPQGLRDVNPLISEGLVEQVGQRLRLTLRGRLLADAVARRLLGW